HEEDALPQLRRSDGGRITAGPRTDDDEVDVPVHGPTERLRSLNPFANRGILGRARARRENLESFHEDGRRMFEIVAYRLDERGADVAIEHAVGERARQVHHLRNRDMGVTDDRFYLVLVDDEGGYRRASDDRSL